MGWKDRAEREGGWKTRAEPDVPKLEIRSTPALEADPEDYETADPFEVSAPVAALQGLGQGLRRAGRTKPAV